MVDFRDWEGGGRDAIVGLLLMVAMLLICGLCFVGAWTVGHWIWRLA